MKKASRLGTPYRSNQAVFFREAMEIKPSDRPGPAEEFCKSSRKAAEWRS